VRAHAVEVDVDARRLSVVARLERARVVAPRQELRIELDAIDELEHRIGGKRHEHRLLHAAHEGVARMGSVRATAACRVEYGTMSIVDKKKAYHDYFIEEKFEAGVALLGWEVKAVRAGR